MVCDFYLLRLWSKILKVASSARTQGSGLARQRGTCSLLWDSVHQQHRWNHMSQLDNSHGGENRQDVDGSLVSVFAWHDIKIQQEGSCSLSLRSNLVDGEWSRTQWNIFWFSFEVIFRARIGPCWSWSEEFWRHIVIELRAALHPQCEKRARSISDHNIGTKHGAGWSWMHELKRMNLFEQILHPAENTVQEFTWIRFLQWMFQEDKEETLWASKKSSYSDLEMQKWCLWPLTVSKSSRNNSYTALHRQNHHISSYYTFLLSLPQFAMTRAQRKIRTEEYRDWYRTSPRKNSTGTRPVLWDKKQDRY